MPQEGKADPSPAKREGRANEGIPNARQLALAPAVLSTGQGSFNPVWGETRLVALPASDPNSKSRHAKSLASAGSQDKAVTSRGGSLAKPKSPKTFEKGVRRKLTVYGNGDGYLGRTTADGTVYTKDAWWVAYNHGPKGSRVLVSSYYVCKKGHKNSNTVTAPVKDRMASDKNIDATLRVWDALMWCEACKKAKAHGWHYVTVRRMK